MTWERATAPNSRHQRSGATAAQVLLLCAKRSSDQSPVASDSEPSYGGAPLFVHLAWAPDEALQRCLKDQGATVARAAPCRQGRQRGDNARRWPRVRRLKRMPHIPPTVAIELVLAVDSYAARFLGLWVRSSAASSPAESTIWLHARDARKPRGVGSAIPDGRCTTVPHRSQDLQATCQIHKAGDGDEPSREAVERAFNDFFHVYAVVQTIAERRVVDAARITVPAP